MRKMPLDADTTTNPEQAGTFRYFVTGRINALGRILN